MFTAPTNSNRDYRQLWAAAYKFHERHNQQCPDWDALHLDMGNLARQYDDDPFLVALLVTAFEEVEREAAAQKADTG